MNDRRSAFCCFMSWFLASLTEPVPVAVAVVGSVVSGEKSLELSALVHRMSRDLAVAAFFKVCCLGVQGLAVTWLVLRHIVSYDLCKGWAVHHDLLCVVAISAFHVFCTV